MCTNNNTFELDMSQIEHIIRICDRIKPLLAVNCITYNHEPYIRDTLEGFVLQRTNFPFVAVVHDDASTDGTADIIKEYAAKYPELIIPFIETENQYSKCDGSLQRRMNACIRGEYVAFCEGDDWWTDPLKLQKQVDFLEANPDYGLCYTKISRYSQLHGEMLCDWGGDFESFEQHIQGNVIPTLSVVIRRHLVDEYLREVQPQTHGWKMGDYPMWLYAAAHSKIKFLPCITGVYRILEQSMSHDRSYLKMLAFRKSTIDIRLFFLEKYGHGLPAGIHADQQLRYMKFDVLEKALTADKAGLDEAVERLKSLILSMGIGTRLKLFWLIYFPRTIARIKKIMAERKEIK